MFDATYAWFRATSLNLLAVLAAFSFSAVFCFALAMLVHTAYDASALDTSRIPILLASIAVGLVLYLQLHARWSHQWYRMYPLFTQRDVDFIQRYAIEGVTFSIAQNGAVLLAEYQDYATSLTFDPLCHSDQTLMAQYDHKDTFLLYWLNKAQDDLMFLSVIGESLHIPLTNDRFREMA